LANFSFTLPERIAWQKRQYVHGILFRMRDEVDANPDFFDSDAQERIDEAIALLQSPGEKASAA
jgi:hypothetical protein